MTPRVVHVDTERTWGGGQRQLWWLARGLARRGRPSWVAARPRTRLAAELAAAGIPLVPLAPAWEWDPRAARTLRTALQEVGADVVHAHAAHAVALAGLARVGLDVTLVASRRVALRLRRNPLSRWKYARVDRFIAVSQRVRRALRDSGIDGGRIVVVPSGVDVGVPTPPASAGTLRGLGVDPQRPLMVMVSSLVPPHKDPQTFVAAVAAARASGCDVQALLVGDGPLAAGARRLARRLGLDGAIRFAGHRDDAEALLASADVAVLSSRDEGLGTTLLDAMLAGVPIVATAAGGVMELVRDGVEALLVPIGDGAALGQAVAQVLGNAALRAGLADAGRRRVRQFSVEATVEGTLAVYATLPRRVQLGGRRATP
jgi:glycosyltransferase involved in cell wall biosynthesis